MKLSDKPATESWPENSRAVAEISLVAIQANLAVVRQHAPKSRIMAVIKADAYGHGALQVAHALVDADALAVATVDEALALRWGGIQKDIVVLEGFIGVAELLSCDEHHLIPVVHSPEQITCLRDNAKDIQSLSVWLKVDTGMSRLGLPASALLEAINALTTTGTQLIGLMSHLACADEPDNQMTQRQIQLFKALLAETRAQYPSGVVVASLANSAGILHHPESHLDWVRPGIMLYGASPSADVAANDYGLFPAMQLSSRIIAIQDVPQGAAVGYGGTWTAAKSSRIAICALGYADGFLRQQSGRYVSVAGKRATICGRISMDMTAINVTDMQVQVGDWVTVWGEAPTVDEVAATAGTIGYEVLCGLGQRVDIVYR